MVILLASAKFYMFNETRSKTTKNVLKMAKICWIKIIFGVYKLIENLLFPLKNNDATKTWRHAM